MVEWPGLLRHYKKPLTLLGIIVIAIALVMVIAAVTWVCIFVYVMSSMDDPFRPQAPYYEYRAGVTGLEGFETANGSAVIMLPLPVADGAPVLSRGWWVNYPPDPREQHHGMLSLGPVNTSMGPMLEARINMTDNYLSEAGATPIAVSPGQNTSMLPGIVPVVINKSWSFDDVHVIASGGIGALDYPTSAEGRAAMMQFLETPLEPAENYTGFGNFTTYVYIDPALKPIRNDSVIRVSGFLEVQLNHNKVNASEEGRRLFEYHNYMFNETIPGGVTGYVPIRIQYVNCSGLNNCIGRT